MILPSILNKLSSADSCEYNNPVQARNRENTIEFLKLFNAMDLNDGIKIVLIGELGISNQQFLA